MNGEEEEEEEEEGSGVILSARQSQITREMVNWRIVLRLQIASVANAFCLGHLKPSDSCRCIHRPGNKLRVYSAIDSVITVFVL